MTKIAKIAKITKWHGCYDGNHKDLITPEAFSHPAKMSRMLCERIFDYGQEKGYWRPGDQIVDPFGGIGTTGLIGAYRGYNVVLVELEEHFVRLANENIELNRAKLEVLGNLLPFVIHGDSRNLVELIGGMDGAISSPPYADSVNAHSSGIDWDKAGRPERNEPSDSRQAVQAGGLHFSYSQSKDPTNGQIGAESGDTYWTAVAMIYRQVYALLPSGGAFAVVVKDFVRNKQRVPLCDQTAQLLKSIGFDIPERMHAMLVKEIAQPIDMFTGESAPIVKERKSFFRRLAEKKGSPAIDWEEVIWAVKP